MRPHFIKFSDFCPSNFNFSSALHGALDLKMISLKKGGKSKIVTTITKHFLWFFYFSINRIKLYRVLHNTLDVISYAWNLPSNSISSHSTSLTLSWDNWNNYFFALIHQCYAGVLIEVVFCFQNYSDLLWENGILLTKVF